LLGNDSETNNETIAVVRKRIANYNRGMVFCKRSTKEQKQRNGVFCTVCASLYNGEELRFEGERMV
jgi:hypothetical protein